MGSNVIIAGIETTLSLNDGQFRAALQKSSYDAKNTAQHVSKSWQSLGVKLSDTGVRAKGAQKAMAAYAETTSKGARMANQSLSAIPSKIGAIAISLWGAQAAAKAVFNQLRQGAVAQDSLTIFKSMGYDIAEFRKETNGLFSDRFLVQKFNFAKQMGIDEDSFMKLAKMSDAAAKKMGISQEHAMESLTVGTARGSKLILDNVGILFQAGKAHEKYANSMGRTVKSLSDVEKKQAELNFILAEGDKMIADVQGVGATASDVFDQWDATTDNLITNMGRMVVQLASVEGGIFSIVEAARVWGRVMEDIGNGKESEDLALMSSISEDFFRSIPGYALGQDAANSVMDFVRNDGTTTETATEHYNNMNLRGGPSDLDLQRLAVLKEIEDTQRRISLLEAGDASGKKHTTNSISGELARANKELDKMGYKLLEIESKLPAAAKKARMEREKALKEEEAAADKAARDKAEKERKAQAERDRRNEQDKQLRKQAGQERLRALDSLAISNADPEVRGALQLQQAINNKSTSDVVTRTGAGGKELLELFRSSEAAAFASGLVDSIESTKAFARTMELMAQVMSPEDFAKVSDSVSSMMAARSMQHGGGFDASQYTDEELKNALNPIAMGKLFAPFGGVSSESEFLGNNGKTLKVERIQVTGGGASGAGVGNYAARHPDQDLSVTGLGNDGFQLGLARFLSGGSKEGATAKFSQLTDAGGAISAFASGEGDLSSVGQAIGMAAGGPLGSAVGGAIVEAFQIIAELLSAGLESVFADERLGSAQQSFSQGMALSGIMAGLALPLALGSAALDISKQGVNYTGDAENGFKRNEGRSEYEKFQNAISAMFDPLVTTLGEIWVKGEPLIGLFEALVGVLVPISEIAVDNSEVAFRMLFETVKYTALAFGNLYLVAVALAEIYWRLAEALSKAVGNDKAAKEARKSRRELEDFGGSVHDALEALNQLSFEEAGERGKVIKGLVEEAEARDELGAGTYNGPAGFRTEGYDFGSSTARGGSSGGTDNSKNIVVYGDLNLYGDQKLIDMDDDAVFVRGQTGNSQSLRAPGKNRSRPDMRVGR